MLDHIIIQKDYLYQKYIIERLPIQAISRELNIGRYFIRKYLKYYHIESRGKSSSHRFGFDELFFHKPNNINSYWAGFIAADGCILNHKTNNILQITLCQKDHQHLEIFKNHINYSGCIKKFSRISILGTQNLLSWIKYTLLELLKCKGKLTINERMGEKSKYYELRLDTKYDIINLYNYIKKLNIPILDRKWDKLNMIILN